MKKLILSSLLGLSLLSASLVSANYAVVDGLNGLENFQTQCMTAGEREHAQVMALCHPNNQNFAVWYTDSTKFDCKEAKPLCEVRCSPVKGGSAKDR